MPRASFVQAWNTLRQKRKMPIGHEHESYIPTENAEESVHGNCVSDDIGSGFSHLDASGFRDPANTSVKRLRIAMYTNNGFIQASPALRRAVHEAADELRKQGAEVEQWTPPDVNEAMRIYLGLLRADGMVRSHL
ncbi:MAG TPA: amidase family protein [Pyrinomonadaceae bacterium]|nr:amidase family protein [Pyrinomonadaceae bacterium]